jgi:hypothetical protein
MSVGLPADASDDVAQRDFAARVRYGVMDDDAILALVTRLARPHASGGSVIERAAILAEGTDFPAVMAWITAHEGLPEPTVAMASTRGLHGSRLNDPAGEQPRPPLRFVLPAGTLT